MDSSIAFPSSTATTTTLPTASVSSDNDDKASVTPKPAFATFPKAASPAQPVLSSPSGRLARRRNRGVIPFPGTPISSTPIKVTPPATPSPTDKDKQLGAKATPIAVPKPRRHARQPPASEPQLSRSAPALSHFPRPREPKGVVFPVVDDLDADSTEDDDVVKRPLTPSPMRIQKKGIDKKGALARFALGENSDDTEDDDLTTVVGSVTAPPTGVRRAFATSMMTSPSPAPRTVKDSRRPPHKRAPSFPTVFMSSGPFGMHLPSESDSELASTMNSASKVAGGSPSPFALSGAASVGGVLRRPRLQSATRSTSTPNGKLVGALEKGGMFAYASSSFQNSPSPEQLPAPSFAL